MTALRLRDAEAADVDFLAQMLVEAAAWRDPGTGDPSQVLSNPYYAHYIEGWPLPRDVGVIAELDEPVGAAWFRFLTESDPGFGFVAVTVPEITVGVAGAHRGKGIGTALVMALTERARAAGVSAMSLSVENENPVMALYQRMGFVQVGGHATATTMLLEISPA